MSGGRARPGTAGLDTIPKLLLHHAEVRPDRPAMREKKLGIWRAWSWREVAAEVGRIAAGLSALGLERGERMAVIGNNRPPLYWAMVAAQALGAVPVPLYQDASGEELADLITRAGARFVLAEDQEQVDKLIAIKERVRALEEILYLDPRGLKSYRASFLHGLAQVMAQGRARADRAPGFLKAEIGRGAGHDAAGIYYTPGTSGSPKGVVLSFENVISTAQAAVEFEALTERENVLAHLPMASIGDAMISVGQAYCAGFTVNCPESPATVMQDMREIGPSYFFASPKTWQAIHHSVAARMDDARPLRRRLYRAFMRLARSEGERLLQGEPVGLGRRSLYRLGEPLIYGPLKDALGMGRVRLAYTSGEAAAAETFHFFRSIGINLKQIYGATEGAMFVAIQPDGDASPDTVGRALPDVGLRIADDGEVLFRGPGLFQEYHGDEAATLAARTADGWARTGDKGTIDRRGNLRLAGRVGDADRLADGRLFAPGALEDRFRQAAHIAEIVALVHDRDGVAGLVTIDAASVRAWAERQGLAYTNYRELVARAEVLELIRRSIERVNAGMVLDPILGSLQLRRFLILQKPFDPDDGELTRTGKLRRHVIAERYGALIDALYSDAEMCEAEVPLAGRDGRAEMVKTRFAISAARVFARAPEKNPLLPGQDAASG
ncbi:MAG: AMP-dependent synthetase/ligase [Acetobacteraceae bacterium]